MHHNVSVTPTRTRALTQLAMRPQSGATPTLGGRAAPLTLHRRTPGAAKPPARATCGQPAACSPTATKRGRQSLRAQPRPTSNTCGGRVGKESKAKHTPPSLPRRSKIFLLSTHCCRWTEGQHRWSLHRRTTQQCLHRALTAAMPANSLSPREPRKNGHRPCVDRGATTPANPPTPLEQHDTPSIVHAVLAPHCATFKHV